MQIFKGVATALVTPFNKKNKINFEIFKHFIDFQIQNQIDALVFLGTTGEASTLSEKEKLAVAEFAVDYVNNRVPVILGAGGNNTKDVVLRSKRFEKIGASALLQVTPYYNKATQSGLIEHYKKIAKSCNLPQILYNVPSRTGLNILPETLNQLAKIPNIAGLKEAGGNLAQLTEILSQKQKNFAVFSGDDENIFTTLALGGDGVISVISNILPKQTVQITRDFFAGNISAARQHQFALLPKIRALFQEVNPIPIKEALRFVGFDMGLPRLPLSQCSTNLKHELERLFLNN